MDDQKKIDEMVTAALRRATPDPITGHQVVIFGSVRGFSWRCGNGCTWPGQHTPSVSQAIHEHREVAWQTIVKNASVQ